MLVYSGGNGDQVEVRVLFETPSTYHWTNPSEEEDELVYPQEFSTFENTVTGTMDGVNDVFTLSSSMSYVAVYLDGKRLTRTLHFTHSGATITFFAPMIPQLGSDILVVAW